MPYQRARDPEIWSMELHICCNSPYVYETANFYCMVGDLEEIQLRLFEESKSAEVHMARFQLMS
jgi:hypothetical protein